jgi:hypothetical protein
MIGVLMGFGASFTFWDLVTLSLGLHYLINFTQLTTELSDPTQGTPWFSGRTPNPDFADYIP